jgi:hypothetical protein
VVTVAPRSSGIYYVEQFLNLGVGEGRGEFSGWSWNLYPVKGVVLDYTLGDKPGKENPEAAQVAVDCVSREPPILDRVEAVIGETPLLLKMENEGPDFMLTDLRYIFVSPLSREKVEKVVHAVGDDSDGIRAFAFGSGTELIPSDKV